MKAKKKKSKKARSEAADLRYFRNPPKMTIEQALRSKNPVYEISIRVRAPYNQMTRAERLFWKVGCFQQDTLNGSFIQSMTNSTGEYAPAVRRFCHRYCSPELSALFDEVASLFRKAEIPRSRKARSAAVARMGAEDDDDHPLYLLSRHFYSLNADLNAGLVKFAAQHKDQFVHMG